MRRFLCGAAALLAAAAVGVGDAARARTTCHPEHSSTVALGDLDGDRTLEPVIESDKVSCPHAPTDGLYLGIKDDCGAQGSWSVLASRYDRLERAQILEADGRPDRRELFYVVRRRPERLAGLGSAGIVHLRTRASDTCPTPAFLFLYRTEQPSFGPSGAPLTDFAVTVKELNPRVRGKEVRLVETFGSADARTRRTTLYRFAPARHAYVPYAVSLAPMR